MKKSFEEYECLNDFFVREIKQETRPIGEAEIVSPCDGKVLSVGDVTSDFLDSIKGRYYRLTLLLTGMNNLNYEEYSEYLKKDRKNHLKYITIYLAPGDYHRFHSPSNWEVTYRRHLFGYLLGVFEFNLWRKKDIFTINERVAYFGKWKFGALHYVAIGAYNVGSIHVNCDPELETNKKEFKDLDHTYEEKEIKHHCKKGEEFGRFNAGSTIVMIVEAPEEAKWSVQNGDRVKMGQDLLLLPNTASSYFFFSCT